MQVQEPHRVLDSVLQDTKALADLVLTAGDLDIIESTLAEATTKPLWLLDEEIGGIGGYCLPAVPTINPFPRGVKRSLFRPLQYARMEMEENFFDETNSRPRYVVEYCGMHLEAAFRVGSSTMRARKTLGYLVHRGCAHQLLAPQMLQAAEVFVLLYNKAKHEVNLLEERPRLFSPCDALVAYVAARRIGKQVLSSMSHDVKSRVLGEHADWY